MQSEVGGRASRAARQHLVLVADDDKIVCNTISDCLLEAGYKTVLAFDGRQALELYQQLDPSLSIVDIRMPTMSGLEFLEEVQRNGHGSPVLITTGYPDVETAIESLKNGAFDYLVKPLQLEIMEQKVQQALNASRLENENLVLAELASLHDITTRLSNTHDLPQLVDVALQCCLQVSRADSGSIQLLDKSTDELVVVRQHGVSAPRARYRVGDDGDEGAISKWVQRNGRSVMIAGDRVYPSIDLPLHRRDIGSSISVPLKVEDKTIGVVSLNRSTERSAFSMVHLNTIEVLAAQAGISINNANLYLSVNQKLSELTLISTYSERLMGLVERTDIVRCLFETVKDNFAIDVIGYLAAHKRRHEFLYWARGHIGHERVETVRDEVVAEHNRGTGTAIHPGRVAVRRAAVPTGDERSITEELHFRHMVWVMSGHAEYGLLFLGARAALDNQAEKTSLLASLVNQTRIALTNAKLYTDMKENYIRTIKALAIAVDAKDTYTHGHSENVMNIAEEICRELAADSRVIGSVRDGGLLHDIGKIGIPGYILNKPGSLTYDEFNGIMKTHPSLGANIVRDVPFLRELYELILHHHENYDGTGYPDGLRGKEIPLGARVIHVADAFEAMTSNRPYRDSLGRKEAIRRLREERGKQFDPGVVDAFMTVAGRKGWLDDMET